MECAGELLLAAAALLFAAAAAAVGGAWLRLKRTRQLFRRQGIDGPPPSLLLGNLPEMRRKPLSPAPAPETTAVPADGRRRYGDYNKAIFPYFDRWKKSYGPTFVYWMGRRAAVYTAERALVREISLCVSLDLGKPTYMQKGQEPLFGLGILKSNGPLWAHQRKVIGPHFYINQVKGMVELMVEAAQSLVSSWELAVDGAGGNPAAVKIDGDLRSFSFDVISRASFGSDYNRGRQIFLKLRALSGQMAGPSHIFETAFLRFLPTEKNKRVRQLVQDIRSLILQLVKERRSGGGPPGGDFLGSLLLDDAAADDDFIVDNCKNIYYAGYETSACTATWCLMLLAAHPEWQAAAQAEVAAVLNGAAAPDFDKLTKMKTLTMVVQETLRLFPPSSLVVREAFNDMKLGKLQAPQGTYIFIPVPTVHHDPAIWGADADEFRPERFKNGVSGACRRHPQAYLPFGLGARTCVGQNLAMAEVKTVLAMVLSRFSFRLSPEYRHSPAFRLVVEPEHGVTLLIKKFNK